MCCWLLQDGFEDGCGSFVSSPLCKLASLRVPSHIPFPFKPMESVNSSQPCRQSLLHLTLSMAGWFPSHLGRACPKLVSLDVVKDDSLRERHILEIDDVDSIFDLKALEQLRLENVRFVQSSEELCTSFGNLRRLKEAHLVRCVWNGFKDVPRKTSRNYSGGGSHSERSDALLKMLRESLPHATFDGTLCDRSLWQYESAKRDAKKKKWKEKREKRKQRRLHHSQSSKIVTQNEALGRCGTVL